MGCPEHGPDMPALPLMTRSCLHISGKPRSASRFHSRCPLPCSLVLGRSDLDLEVQASLAREAELAEANPSFVAAGDVPGEEEVSGVAADGSY